MHYEQPSKQARSALPPAGVLKQRLGTALRQVRLQAGVTTRHVGTYSSGHVSNVENGRTTPSARFVDEYVRMGGDAARLLHLLDQIHRASRDAAADGSATGRRRPASPRDPLGDAGGDHGLADPRADPQLLRRGYDIDAVEDVHLIGADAQPSWRQHTVWLRPVNPLSRFFPFRHSVPEQPRRGTSVVTAGPGCSVAVQEESTNGGLFVVLEFDPAARDAWGRCTLSWSIALHLDGGVLSAPRSVSGTKSRISRASHRVQFTEPHTPNAVWWWRGFDEQEALMDPAGDRLLHAAENQQYSVEVLDAEAEWWGLGWTWPTPI